MVAVLLESVKTPMKTSMRLLLLSMLVAACTATAHAAGLAVLPVAIDPASQMPDAVRDECRIDFQLQSDIVAALQRYDSEAKAATDESKGQALRVTITYVLGLGGGSWTGPKVLAVKAEYLNDGKVDFTTKMRRRSGMGAFRGTCTLLDGAAKGLAKNLARWAQHPKSSVKEEEDPDSTVDTGKHPHSRVVNGIDPDAEAPVADPASSAAQ